MSDAARGARYSDLFHERHLRDEHGVDSGAGEAPECQYCPICRAIAIARKTDPAALEHLAAGARELMLALGMFLEKAGETLVESGAPDGRVESQPPDAGRE